MMVQLVQKATVMAMYQQTNTQKMHAVAVAVAVAAVAVPWLARNGVVASAVPVYSDGPLDPRPLLQLQL